MKSPTFASFLALLALLASVQGAIMAHAQTVNGWTNYSDPNGKWTIQYPSYWLARNPKTNISIMNESMFTSGNGSVVIIAVTANDPIKTLSNNGYQFNCDTTLLAGHRTCVSINHGDQNIDGRPIHGLFFVTTINGTNYGLQLFDTQANFEKSFPVFMQMIWTFRPK